MDMQPKITADTLDFVKNQVLNVTDITRTTKLTEILDSYANKVSEQIFVIQNSRNKEAQGILADIDYFQQLLQYKHAVDSAIDDIVYQVALERKDDVADIPLGQVIDELDLDVDEILRMANDVELE